MVRIARRLKWYVTAEGIHRGYHRGRLQVLVRRVSAHAMGTIWIVASPKRARVSGGWERRIIARPDRLHAVAADVWAAMAVAKMVAGLQSLSGAP